ncbi:hypothetical protein AB1A81_02095 [Bdellovibrio bacteriovorus]|uniref:Uncharacterized protein n=1 Tax=Bdellovibrio bacteriovorus (strain ATCC 15356 / DSM 50701 / NCIMB 9529 / HD100) TaxID=264462 RepID=Q6MQL2_BDEBA|nr:hypothetical protein [Bdellovibrio bacteriovorus]AHZ86069.1 hypothetical protein EP01_14175 [Bdellovibrio bacteriovorus]BEV66994.1 hypothetical protein Bb109J_c0414 [Bdellovibrio bacteriovorus]CAE78435.1 hypothetical protein predicted by Glimmer/Critica [Bdellovibrio bacteriovorus HD100]
MRYLMLVVMVLTVLWSAYGQAMQTMEASRMSFRIQPLGGKGYDYSAIWNPISETAMLRIGLVLNSADAFLVNKSISFATASAVDFETSEGISRRGHCEVDQWYLEYEPGLPNYLMYVGMKGPGCADIAKEFDILQVRFNFKGISLPQFVPIDVAVDISR